MKKALKVILAILILLVVLAGAMLVFLSIDEYKPEESEKLDIIGQGTRTVAKSNPIKLVTWNLGYGALGDNADFFFDGGKSVRTADKERVLSNLDNDISVLEGIDPDIICVQEIDFSSSRSHYINESDYFLSGSDISAFSGFNVSALNFDVAYIPLPIPPIGKVKSGIEVFSDYNADEAVRLRLPCPFNWPYRTINLKRCLEIVRFPIDDCDNELVVVNLHLEAYDDGEGKEAQTRVLKEVLDAEVSKGNYVIAVGDFNQVFSSIDTSSFPKLNTGWEAGRIDENEFGEEFQFLADEKVASCRSLEKPLDSAESRDPKDFQYYIIDGAICSANVEVLDFHIEDQGFVSSDHNPGVLEFMLK